MHLQLSQNKKFKKPQKVFCLQRQMYLNHVSVDTSSNTSPIFTSPPEEERAIITWPRTPSNSRDDELGQLVFPLRPQIFRTLWSSLFSILTWKRVCHWGVTKDVKNIRRIWKKHKQKENEMTGIKSHWMTLKNKQKIL